MSLIDEQGGCVDDLALRDGIIAPQALPRALVGLCRLAAECQARRILDILKRSRVCSANEIKTIRSGRDAAEYLRPRLDTEREEVALMICLNAQMGVINCVELARGTVNAVVFNIRRVVELALKSKASYVILAHNHPGGVPRMSREDDAVTARVYKALDLVNIRLYDHIIVAGGEYASVNDLGGMRLYSY